MKHWFALGMGGLLLFAEFSVSAAEVLTRESAEAFMASLKKAQAENAGSQPRETPGANEIPAPDDPGTTPSPGTGNRITPLPRGTNRISPVISERELNRALVLIGDSSMRGSGFLLKLWGKPVIITNAHVFALMDNPEVMNANHEKFTVVAALVGRMRDLAILQLKEDELPADLPFLSIVENVAELEHDARISAYGDSLGERVIVKSDGKLLGIGPDEVEIDAEIVPGNSGGPVLDQSNRVVAVSTYLRKLTASADLLAGTRFSDKDEKLGKSQGKSLIRRFALRIDKLNLDDFECFDRAAQQKDLALYRKFDGIKRLCFNEIMNPHYNWTLYWPWTKKKPLENFVGISNYLYCYDHFYQTDFKNYFSYHASLSIIQRLLEQQQAFFAIISCFLHVNPVQLNQEELADAQRIFQKLQKDRKGKFICPQCGGTRQVPIPGSSRGADLSIEYETCPDCEGFGRYAVPYYGPWRVSPLFRFPRSKYQVSGFRLGMELNEANRVANEIWRRDTSEYNIISINGLFDCVRVNRNPEFGNRAYRTELKFLARRLLSMTIFFEHDQHNLQQLKERMKQKYGEPDFEFEVPGDWGYLMYQKEDITLTLSYYEGQVMIRAHHRVLQHVEYMVLNTLEQKLFCPPLKDYGGQIDFLP